MPATRQMPTTGGSAFLKKLGAQLQRAHEEHKDDETEFSAFGDIPAGINGGVAQLTECKIGQYENGDLKGEFFFYAHGAILAPKVFTDPESKMPIKVEGKLTKIGPEPLCDTPNAKGKRKTFSDHLGWVYNELRKLGIDTGALDPSQLEVLCEEIKKPENAPIFTFRTWKGNATPEFPNPRTNHDWEGVCEYTPTETPEQHVSGAATQAPPPAQPARTAAAAAPRNGTPPPAARPAVPPRAATPPSRPPAAPATPPKPSPSPARPVTPPSKPSTPPARPTAPPKPAAPPPPQQGEFDEFGDLDSLLTRAKADDGDAQNALCELAQKNGWSKDDTDNAPGWDEVHAMCLSGPEGSPGAEGGEDTGGAEGSGWTGDPPAVGEVHLYTPANGKQGEYEVKEVDEANRTVKLKSLDNPRAKVTGPVSWDELSPATTE